MMKRHIVDIAKKVISPTFNALGIYDKEISKIGQKSCWLIPTYHRIITDSSDDPFRLGMCVTAKHFEQQLIYFKENFLVLPMDEATNLFKQGKQFDRPVVSITFDDGYLDNLDLAQPLLEKHGLSAHLYVAIGGLDKKEVFWWDRVIYSFAHSKAKKLDCSQLQIEGFVDELSLSGSKKYQSLCVLLDKLWSIDVNVCYRAVDLVEEKLQAIAPVSWAARMTSEQIQQIHTRGMTIGAHSDLHHNLTLMTQQKIKEEVGASIDLIKTIVGDEVSSFAFPAGRKSDEVFEVLKNYDLDHVAGTDRGVNSGEIDYLDLKRICMPDSSVSDFKRCLADIIKTPA